MEAWLFVLAAVAVGVVAYLQWRARQKRRDDLAHLAHSLGLSFDPRSRKDLPPHKIFERGHSRRRFHTMSGSIELGERQLGVVMGDYRFTEGSGDKAKTYKLSYAIVTLPYLGTPNLVIREEGLADRLKSAVGFDDIDFESEEFSRKFWVTSNDKRFAYDVVHPRMMEFLLRRPAPKLELRYDALCLHSGRRRWEVDQFSVWLAWARSFIDLWPEHLVDRFPPRKEWAQ